MRGDGKSCLALKAHYGQQAGDHCVRRRGDKAFAASTIALGQPVQQNRQNPEALRKPHRIGRTVATLQRGEVEQAGSGADTP